MSERQEGGYDVNIFCEEVLPSYICTICQQVLKDPQEAQPCRHVYCSGCISRWLNENFEERSCPTCRETIVSQVNSPPYFRQLVDALSVKCHSSCGGGCASELPLGKLAHHLAHVCPAGVISCPFKVHGCETPDFCRGELEKHVEECTFNPLAVIPCPQCGENIERAYHTNHINDDCPLTEVGCSFPGCDFRTERGAIEEHEQEAVRTHVKVLCEEIKTLKEENSYLRKSLTHQSAEISELRTQLEGQQGYAQEQYRRTQDQISYITGTVNSRLPEASRSQFMAPRTQPQFGKRPRLETEGGYAHPGSFECYKCGANPPLNKCIPSCEYVWTCCGDQDVYSRRCTSYRG